MRAPDSSCCACARVSRRRSSAAAAAGPHRRADPEAVARSSWPTYNGDYSGRRFSALDEDHRPRTSSTSAWRGSTTCRHGGGTIKATPLQVDGVLYFATPDHAYAVEARTGREIWHYTWPRNRGGNHIGNRGVGDPRRHALLRDARLQPRRARHQDRRGEVVQGVLLARDDLLRLGRAGRRQGQADRRRQRRRPRHAGVSRRAQSGERRADLALVRDAAEGRTIRARHLAQPRHGEARRRHDVAADHLRSRAEPDLRHDRQSAAGRRLQEPRGRESVHGVDRRARTPTPARWRGTSSRRRTTRTTGMRRRRRCCSTARSTASRASSLAQASRNGQFFVLDRTNGKAIVSTEYIKTNWSLGYDERGQPIPNPAKRPQIAGALVTPNQGGATNWYPPSFSPQTGLFYVNATRAFSVWYIYDASDNPMGWGGTDRGGYAEQGQLKAIDYRTGKIRWSMPRYGGNSGLLTHRRQRPVRSARRRPRRLQRDDRRAAVALAHRRRHQRPDHLRARRAAVRGRRRGGAAWRPSC